MGFVYRQQPFEDGDAVLAEEDWNLNLAELLGEWNGSLDRDNVPVDALTSTHLKANGVSLWGNQEHTTTDTLDDSTTGWQRQSLAGVNLGLVQLTLPTDGTAEVEASVGHEWTSTSPGLQATEGYWIRYRLTMDGTEIALSGWLCATARRNAAYLEANVAVSAGEREFRLEAMVVKNEGDFDYGTHTTIASVEACAVRERELVVEVTLR